jgi:biopolymer transport protein ExbD
MRRHLGHASRFEAGPNMTPLVDVVMVILIFLMLVGTFASSEWFLEQKAGMTQTATSTQQPPPKDFVPDEPIVIRVTYRSDDQYLAQADKISTGDKVELEQKLTAMREQLTSIGKPIDKLVVVIQPQPNVKHRQYMEVYEAALAAKFTKVSFAVTQ